MPTRRLLAALLLGPLALACGGDDVHQADDGRLVRGRLEVDETTTRGVAPGGRTLVFDGFNGTIRLRGTAGETASLEFTRRARGDDEEDARDALTDISLEETGDDEAYRYVMRSERDSGTQMDVEGTVPRGTSIRIELGNGTVALSALDGPLEVEVGNGTVEVGGAGGDVMVETGNGNIEVGMARVPAETEVALRAGNGNLRLTLPGTADARIDARTSVGDVRVEGLQFDRQDLETRAVTGKAFEAQLGRGTARIALETQSGSITISEGTVAALPGLADEAATAPAPTAPAPTAPAPTAPAPTEQR